MTTKGNFPHLDVAKLVLFIVRLRNQTTNNSGVNFVR